MLFLFPFKIKFITGEVLGGMFKEQKKLKNYDLMLQ